MNYLQTTFRLLASGVLAFTSSAILVASANAGSTTKQPSVKQPSAQPTGFPTTPTKPTMPMTGAPALESPTTEADCDDATSIQSSVSNPTTDDRGTASIPSAVSSGNTSSSLSLEQPKKSGSLSGTAELPKLANSTTSSQAGKKPTASKPCPVKADPAGATAPTSEMNAPGAMPGELPSRSGASDESPAGTIAPTEAPGSSPAK